MYAHGQITNLAQSAVVELNMSATKFILLGLLAAYHITGHEINQEQSLGRFTPFQAVLGNSSIEAGESPFFGLTKRQTCNPGDGYCSSTL